MGMKKLYVAAVVYLILGLSAGVFYREFTRVFDGAGGSTQLNTLHTHLMSLGVLFFLIALLLERSFRLSAHPNFTLWFWLHNIALFWTIGFMTANGIVHATGNGDAWTAMWSGLAGVGHILLTVSFALFFVILGKRVRLAGYRDARAPEGA